MFQRLSCARASCGSCAWWCAVAAGSPGTERDSEEEAGSRLGAGRGDTEG